MRTDASTVKIAYNIARNCGFRGKMMISDRAEIRGATHSSSHTGMRHAPAIIAKRTSFFILPGTQNFGFTRRASCLGDREKRENGIAHRLRGYSCCYFELS